MTPSKEEYLYKLADLSENSYTSNYVAEVIEEVIEKSDQIKYQQLYQINGWPENRKIALVCR